MRTLLPLLIVLLVAGCAKQEPLVSPLKPIEIDETAAYPKQEPGTRPPVLTGTLSLTKEQLGEGWICLFDGVSTYGWSLPDSDERLAVKTWMEHTVLLLAEYDRTKDHEDASRNASFSLPEIVFDESFDMWVGGLGRNAPDGEPTIAVITKTMDNEIRGNAKMVVSGLSGCTGFRVKPKDPKPLAEADWRPAAGESKAAWSDGVLELTGGLGMVETVKEYGDFVLQLEYRTDRHGTEPGVNSGVFFRCIPGETLNGYECQVFNNPPAEDYEKFIGTDTGGIFRRCVGRNVGPKDGEWNYLTVAARGPMIATWVNGIQTVDWTDTRKEDENPRKGLRLKPGTIQLQGHDSGTKIKFRNVRIAELAGDADAIAP